MSKRKFVEQGLKFFNQFKAYLANINVQSTENLIYTFDKRKLLSEFGTDPDRFTDATAAQNVIKQEFQGMLSDGGKANELFATLGETKFQQIFGVDNVDDFLDDVIPILDDFLDLIIKVE